MLLNIDEVIALIRSSDEPKAALLAHTSLECSVPINLTLVGQDGKPLPKSLRQMLSEWLSFRQQTVTRRTQRRLERVAADARYG